MAVLGVFIWLGCGLLAYFLMEGACICCDKREWDRFTKYITIIASVLLGPIFLLIAAELFLIADVGRGLAIHKTKRYKD